MPSSATIVKMRQCEVGGPACAARDAATVSMRSRTRSASSTGARRVTAHALPPITNGSIVFVCSSAMKTRSPSAPSAARMPIASDIVHR